MASSNPENHAMTTRSIPHRAIRSCRWPAWLLMAGLLAACGADSPAPDRQDAAAHEPSAAQPPSPAAEPDVRDEPATPTEPLAPTRELEVTVEGQTELREATLFESPQGYAIYVLPQLTMTPEEPCCDIAWARVDDGFTMRIERIDPDQDLAILRGNIELALSSVGEAEVVPPDRISAAGFRDAELFMRARGDGISSTMLVARIDGGRYRITLHLPHREALEGIAPSMWAMLDSLRTTGPRLNPAGTAPR